MDEWIPEEEYKKAKGQLRLQLSGVFEPFNLYGMGIYIPGAIDEVIELVEQFGKRIRGKDVPIILKRNK